MGSVKDLKVLKNASQKEFGEGIFSFTDDYSVFDYGKMPETISGKGESLCRMASYNFEKIKELNLDSHFIEFVPKNKMKVKLVQVIRPEERKITKKDFNYLVPLEVVFRNMLPEGSSLLSRFRSGEAKPEQYGLTSIPEPNQFFEKPLIELFTKLELTDRLLTEKEAKEISALNEKELNEIKLIALKVNDFLNKKASSLNLIHADGKIELGFSPERKLLLVDVFGTLDENRFLFNDMHVSKQIARDFYLKTDWYNELSAAKKSGKSKDEWPVPSEIPSKLLELISEIYSSVAQEWINENFASARPLSKVIAEYRELKQKNNW
ncbi:phosphoribosylaminoimidazolesuccinocarboxamide synthase [Candidatus Micrarchaeota archaeon]|nr:phosphoribosylaminoimidazolesuccinocarboxamide synthase [Candidatus Micrarchaeota archaeon]